MNAQSIIINDDCLLAMKKMNDNYIDFIVTDPPYGLSFMGKHWDENVPGLEIWKEALRICKPGAMLAAFGGSRTHHHLMLAIEQAGWEIRDCIMWLYGSGFPKSHNFGKELGGEWAGFGTALKPSFEPIIIAMKPLDGTFKQNAEKWGVAGINIESSRVGIEGATKRSHQAEYPKNTNGRQDRSVHWDRTGHDTISLKAGRWPANTILDEEATQIIDQQSGFSKSTSKQRNNNPSKNKCMSGANSGHVGFGHNDSGGASRFFYCAKASSVERNRGCEGLPMKECRTGCGGDMPIDDNGNERDRFKKSATNHHPTIKPIALMKYIIKLLAPPGNPTLLDPFCGSGSTLVAAKELGISSIGIEKESEYCEISKNRIDAVKPDVQMQLSLF